MKERKPIKRGKDTFHRVLGTVIRGLSSPPPYSAPFLFADGERLIDLLANRKSVSPLLVGEIKSILRSEDKRTRRRQAEDEVLFERLRRIPNADVDWDRLEQDRRQIRNFLYSNLGVDRSNFFFSLYGEFFLFHDHPYLAPESVVIGPRFDQEPGDKLQRRPRLMPFGVREKRERPIRERLASHHDLTVARGFHWLYQGSEGQQHLSHWEKVSNCILISEGFYYWHGLERALRFGHPTRARLDAQGIARDLGLIRRGGATRRLKQVLNWWEAALFAETTRLYGPIEAHRLCGIKANAGTPSDVEIRRDFIPTLQPNHPVCRCAQRNQQAQWTQTINDCRNRIGARSEGSSGVSEYFLDRFSKFIEQFCVKEEGLVAYTQRIRPVIDIDVFESRDFNALIFPLELHHRQADQVKLKGVAYVSSTADFIENWKKHRTTVEELRTIFTLIGQWNLQAALEAELLRAERLRHAASLGSIAGTLTHIEFADIPDARHSQLAAVAELEELERVLEPEVASAVGKVREALQFGRAPSPRLLRDISTYAALRAPDRARCRRNLRALIERAWRDPDRVPGFLKAAHLRMPKFENRVEESLEVEVVEDAMLHVLDNLLTNAAEAVMLPTDLAEDRRLVEVQGKSERIWLAGEVHQEIRLEIIDHGPTPANMDNTSQWFRPGFSSGKNTALNHGFGLASALKTVALHGGRIWAERREQMTVVSLTLRDPSISDVDIEQRPYREATVSR